VVDVPVGSRKRDHAAFDSNSGKERRNPYKWGLSLHTHSVPEIRRVFLELLSEVAKLPPPTIGQRFAVEIEAQTKSSSDLSEDSELGMTLPHIHIHQEFII
jgi:hypothetical protein